MSVPRNRDVFPGDETIGSNQVRLVYGGLTSVATVFNAPGPKPVNRFKQIGITNVNALSCHDPRDAKSAVSAGVDFGSYRLNVTKEAQIRSYQSSRNNTGFQPGRPIITGVHT